MEQPLCIRDATINFYTNKFENRTVLDKAVAEYLRKQTPPNLTSVTLDKLLQIQDDLLKSSRQMLQKEFPGLTIDDSHILNEIGLYIDTQGFKQGGCLESKDIAF